MADIHESGEDYLEQILILASDEGYARSIDIAAALGYSKPSVSIAMKNLRQSGYITMDEKSHIRLTDAGREVAQRIYGRHLVLTEYLKTLGVPPAIAAQDACKMEHDLSEETFRCISERLRALKGEE